MGIFEFQSYKAFVRVWVEARPKKGHGQFRKIAEALRVSPVFVSQVFNGEKDLSSEQALALSRYLGLTELESEYFLLLVQKERAGTEELRKFHDKQIKKLQAQSRELKKRVRVDLELTEEAKAIFYSSWHYSAIRLLSSVNGHHDVESISTRLGLEREQVAKALEFMSAYGLVEPFKGGYRMGPQVTHLEAGSPLVRSRQIQWRLKAFEKMAKASSEQMFYTGPMVLSRVAAEKIHQRLVQLIQEVTREVSESEAEELACLNVDWFRF